MLAMMLASSEMGTLDYQKDSEAQKELSRSWRQKLFGVSKKDAWDALAHEIGAHVEAGGWWRADKVMLNVAGIWQITLDTYTVSTGKTHQTYTRLRAPYVNRDGFRFRIWRKSIFSNLGKMLGMQDLEIGDSLFDEDFIVQSNDPARVKLMLQNEQIRSYIAAQPRIRFTVQDDEGWFGAQFPEGVDELRFSALGVIKDLDRLRQLFELFIKTLQELHRIGLADDSPPGVKL
jgi:hypothetical protein